MTNKTPQASRPVIRLERRYEAAVEDLWYLWTTKEGFESWWGPEGFRVAVRKLDLRVGGELEYDMIAVAPEQIEFMKKANMPASHGTRGTFAQIVPFDGDLKFADEQIGHVSHAPCWRKAAAMACLAG